MTTEQIDSPASQSRSQHNPRPSSILRLVAVAVGLVLWFWTQSLIARRAFPENGIGDAIHQMTAGIHQSLVDHPDRANGLLISSSLMIDFLGVFLLASAIFGPSIRPFLGLLMLFGFRQICQGLCALPPPPGMIWRYPGFPSLLVTYGTSNDLFFSGHTAIAVFGAIYLGRLGMPLRILGLLIAIFEMTTVLVLRSHYTMDVFGGVITALYIARVADQLSPAVDRLLSIRKLP